MYQNRPGAVTIPPYKQCYSSKYVVCICKLLEETKPNKVFQSPEEEEAYWADFREKHKYFYCDRGLYERWLIMSLVRRKWKHVVVCQRAEETRDKWDPLEVTKRLKLVWTRNRRNSPIKYFLQNTIWWNHVPSEFELCKKQLLAKNIFLFLASPEGAPYRRIKPHPATFFLQDSRGLAAFAKHLFETEAKREALPPEESGKYLWIIKPSQSSGGKGISIIDTFEMFKKEFVHPSELERPEEEIKERFKAGTLQLKASLIAQRYIHDVLLLNGHKFDIRAYMFIASTDPPIVFCHNGYLRINIEPYDPTNINNKYSHISNIGLQKSHPKYEERKESTKWSMKTWSKYMLDKGLTNDPNWIDNVIVPQMKMIMEIAYKSVRKHVEMAQIWPYSFALLGVDFLVDKNFKLWLTEYTKGPAGHATLEKDDTMFPEMMEELFEILFEIDTIRKTHRDFSKLTTPKGFLRIV